LCFPAPNTPIASAKRPRPNNSAVKLGIQKSFFSTKYIFFIQVLTTLLFHFMLPLTDYEVDSDPDKENESSLDGSAVLSPLKTSNGYQRPEGVAEGKNDEV
jgi:hypothetical protein